MQIGGSARAAESVSCRQLKITSPFLLVTVEVSGARNADFIAGVDIGLDNLMGLLQIGDAKRAVLAVKRIGPAFLVFRFLEIWQDIRPVPPGIAHLAP